MTAETFSGILKEKSEAKEGWKLNVDIPSLSANFPTVLNKVPAQDAANLKAGEAYGFSLERGGLKKDKAGQVYNGSQPWHYWWNYRGLAKAEAKPIDGAMKPAASFQEVDRAYQERADARERSIERQVALKEARIAAEWFCSRVPVVQDDGRTPEPEEVAGVFLSWVGRFYQAFVGLLQSPSSVSGQSHEAPERPTEAHEKAEAGLTTAQALNYATKTPVRPPEAPDKSGQAPMRSGQGRSFRHFGEFFQAALEEKNLTKRQALEKLGVTDDAQILPKYGSLEKAWEALLPKGTP